MTTELPDDAITAEAIDAFTVACAKASSVPGATAGDCYRAGLAAALPALTRAAAEQLAAEALWQSGACEPQEAAALARIALTAAQAELSGLAAIVAHAAAQERERILRRFSREAIAQLIRQANLLSIQQADSDLPAKLAAHIVRDLADLLGGTADGAHTPGGAT